MKLKLTLFVEYEPNGVTVEELRQNLQYVASNAAGNGLLTGSSDAEVVTWNATVEAE